MHASASLAALRRALIGLLVLAGGASAPRAQFDLFGWTPDFSQGGSGSTTGDTMHVEGPDSPELTGPCAALMTTTAPYAARVFVRVDFQNLEQVPDYDWPVFVLDGNQTILLHADAQDALFAFDVPAGGSFGFGVASADGILGAGIADFDLLRFEPLPTVILVTGSAAGDELGGHLARASDLDGDGVPDVLAGLPESDVGGTNTGRVLAFSGATGAVIHEWPGLIAGERFGMGVAEVPDTNGDGVPELLVGAPTAPDGFSTLGHARLISGADGTVLHTWTGGTTDPDWLGAAVATVGDVDRDGVTDLALGAPAASGTNNGEVWLVSGASHALLHLLEGPGGHGEFGTVLAAAGDVDADGTPDLLVGAPKYDQPNYLGYAAVRSGATGAVLFSVAGTAYGEFVGSSVAGAGDLNGDGHADVLVGARGWNGFRGRARLYSGADGALLASIEGVLAGEGVGAALAAGDVDGDDVNDLLVGSVSIGLPVAVRVISGSTFELIHLLDSLGTPVGGFYFDPALVSLPDVDGDGFGEIVAGAPKVGHGGTVALIHPRFAIATSGHALAGTHGAPALAGKGLLVSGEPLTLTLSGALENSSAILVLGLIAVEAPFKGGVLVPAPAVIIPGLPTGPAGTHAIVASWPAGVPSGYALYLQDWIADPVAPYGWAASNGLHLRAP